MFGRGIILQFITSRRPCRAPVFLSERKRARFGKKTAFYLDAMASPLSAFSGGSSGPVLFFDTDCGLCNRCVRLLLRLDRRGRLRFAPLQGVTAQRYLRDCGLPTDDFDSMVLVPEWGRGEPCGRHLLRTDAVLEALRQIGGGWRWFAWLRVLPARLRDPLYRVVASCRYHLFGEWKPRPLARAEWAERFLP
jgi:predicted DCC family thiol-disulfide oxidoreductase YuxK